MKERGMIFSAPMVRALLAGAKTQTRRLIKPQPTLIPVEHRVRGGSDHWWPSNRARSMVEIRDMASLGPYGVPGDRLWVRETFSTSARSVYPCPPAWYRADCGKYDDPTEAEHDPGCNRNRGDCFACVADCEGKFIWRPSIFMPRSLSRITLEVTEVRVQRLQDISEEDARAEGYPEDHYAEPRGWYAQLWTEINGDGSWEANPWVWCVSFVRVLP